MLIDTHCHLDFPEFDKDRQEVIRRAKKEGVGYIINIGSSLRGSEKSLELAEEYDFIYAAAGIHPHEADSVDKKSMLALGELAKNEKVAAIGEIGLDYYKNYSKPENQKALFVSLLKLANELNKPAVIHSRQAENETLEALKQAQPVKAAVHCFSGSGDFLKKCLDSGFFISFTCNITYKKSEGLRNLVKLTPLDRLMLETDAPFLPPQVLRGKRNEPLYVKYLAQEIAAIKEIGIDEVAQATTRNAKEFFNLG